MEKRCVFLGDEVLTMQCAELARDAGLDVVGLISTHPHARDWSAEHAVALLDASDGLATALGDLEIDVLLSVAYLRLIPDSVLDTIDVAINFHDGPLPRYAGLNAPNWAILAGEIEHGITWHLIDSGVDTGDVLLADTFAVEPSDTAFSLNARCYERALETFPRVARALAADDLQPVAQVTSGRRVFTRHERIAGAGLVDPARSAVEMERACRAADGGPQRRRYFGALRLVLGDHAFTIEACHAEPGAAGTPGTVTIGDDLRIATDDGTLVVTQLVDETGTLVTPDALVGRELVADGDVLPTSSDLSTHLDRLDPGLSRAEDHAAVRLEASRLASASFPSTARSSGAAARPTACEALTHDGVTSAGVVSAIAAWLAFRTGSTIVKFELTTPALADDLRALGPLALPPIVALDVPVDASIAELGDVVASERDHAERDGIWLRDLIAREPALRTDPPARPDVRITVAADDGAEHAADHDGALLHIVVADGRIELSGDPGAMGATDLERFAGEIAALVGAAADQPDRPALRAAAAAASDGALLDAMNATERHHDESATIDRSVRDRIVAHPDAPALSCGGEQLTYAQLGERVRECATLLRTVGVEIGSFVGIALPRGVDMVVAMLATLERGAAYVPLDPEYPASRLAFMAADAGLTVVVADDADVPWLADLAVPTVTPGAQAAPSEEAAIGSHDGSDLAYMIYTSGSTGDPKGVMLEHRQVTNFFLAMDEVVGPDPGVWLAVTSLSFDISVLELLWTLTRGFHVVLTAPVGAESGDPVPVVAAGANPPSFSLFHFAASDADDADGYRLLLSGAEFADEHGFEAVWIPERHFHEFGGIYPNPSVLAAAVASRTKRVGIRAGSCVLPLHHPARVAEEWAVVDNLSGGRVGIAAAAGWQPNDFVLRPENFADAKQAMLESLDQIERLWRGETVPMEGPKGPVEIRTLPRPVQAELPVWVTSAGNVATFETAGRLGHHLLTHLLGQSIEQLTEKIAAYRAAWRHAGHDGDGHVTLMVHTFLDDDAEAARRQARPHLREYLRSATGLLRDVASSFPTLRSAGADADEVFASMGDDEMEALLDAAVDRYIGTSGLFGSVDDAMEMVGQIASAGADEIACLVDFGIDTDDVLGGLPLIARLRDEYDEHHRTRTPPVVNETVAQLIGRHGCTHLQCTPSLATMLVADPDDRDALRSLRHMLVGGEALPTALAAELRSLIPGRLTNMYGPTETTIWSLVHEVDEPVDGAIPIGRPIANTTIAVLDELGDPVPVGLYGELHIGGSGVARGYHERADLTAARFVERGAAGRMYATGDVVRVLPEGVVEFGGRADHQVKIRGHRVELGEIEAAIEQHPHVVRAVVSAPTSDHGVGLVAHVLPDGAATVDTDELRERLAAQLPDVMVPRAWMLLDELPLTPNGKIDRRALPDPSTTAVAGPTERPADDRERLVAEVWLEALGHDVGRDDNFFDVGGHSLLAVKVFRQLADQTGRALSLTDVFRYPTVRSFAAHLASLDASPAGAAEQEPDGPGPQRPTSRGDLRRRARQGRRTS